MRSHNVRKKMGEVLIAMSKYLTIHNGMSFKFTQLSPQVDHFCQIGSANPTLPPADRGDVENIVAANKCVAVFVLQL